jgi:hypothetical protein
MPSDEPSTISYEPVPYETLWQLPRRDPSAALVEQWLRIGKANPWIKGAYDPPFRADSFRECADRAELFGWLTFGNWSNAVAFSLAGTDICFIQQGECTDEWLTIRHDPAFSFESISWHYILTRKGLTYADAMLNDLLSATPEQCRTLSWTRTTAG